MNEHFTLTFLSHLKSFPVKLARKIGLRESVLWYELFITYGSLDFEFRKESCYLLGIDEGEKIFDNLCHLEYIIKNEDKFKVNLDKIISDADPLSKLLHPFLGDSEFKSLLTVYHDQLKKNGRGKTVESLLKLFDNKSLSQSKKALKLATDNNWITLKFDGFQNNTQGSSGGNNRGGARNFGAGGNANSNPEGAYESEEI